MGDFKRGTLMMCPKSAGFAANRSTVGSKPTPEQIKRAVDWYLQPFSPGGLAWEIIPTLLDQHQLPKCPSC